MKDDISDETLQAIKRVTLGKWGNGNLDKIADHLIDARSQLAEVTKQRDEWKELYERLNESLASNKRLFSSKLAEKVIDDQVKRIKFLEDILSKTQKELLDLKGQ